MVHELAAAELAISCPLIARKNSFLAIGKSSEAQKIRFSKSGFLKIELLKFGY